MSALSSLVAACDSLVSDARYAKKTRALAAALKTWATTLEAPMTYTLIPAGNYIEDHAGEVFDLSQSVTAALVHLAAAHSGGDTNHFYIQLYASRTDAVDDDGYLANSLHLDVFGYHIGSSLSLAPSSYAINEQIVNGAIDKDYGLVLPRFVQANLFFDHSTVEGEAAAISDFALTT